MIERFTPTTSNVYINALYFISLTLALCVSSVCILGKQWIREYEKDISASAREAVRVRQARFDSLEAWKVPQIMAALPVILLAALLLFFSGLLIQLWNASEHTTAVLVSVVVGFTVLTVITTTVVPALCSMQPQRAAFTPFRSPQAWIFFVVYRRLQQWCHSVFHVYAEAPRTLANWSAFDLLFLEIETKEWFNHEISSVHRALRWAYEVLHNYILIDKAVYCCLQRQFHPRDLIKSEGHLSRYAFSSSKEIKVFDNPYHLGYVYSKRIDEFRHMDSVAGRYQAELLIRSAYYAIEHRLEEGWKEIFHCYNKLQECWIFDDYLQEDTLHRMCLHN